MLHPITYFSNSFVDFD